MRSRDRLGRGRRTKRPLHCAALALLCLVGGSGRLLAQEPRTEALSVDGSVVDQDGGALAGVTVTLRSLRPASVTERDRWLGRERNIAAKAVTDAQGRFSLEARHPGLYRVRVSAPGRSPRAVELGFLLDALSLRPVVLERARRLRVRVVDASGQPVSGAHVRLLEDGGAADRPALLRGAWTVAPSLVELSGDDGVAELGAVTRRGQTVSVVAPGFWPAHVEVSPGEEMVVTLQPAPARRIVVREVGGAPAVGAVVRVGAERDVYGITDEQGRLLVPVGAPATRVEVMTQRRGVALARAIAGPERLTLTARRAPAVTGRVLDRLAGTPIVDAFVWSAASRVMSRTNADGRFAIPLLSLAATGAEEEPLEAVARGYDRRFVDPQQARPSSSPAFLLQPVGRIVGTVVDVQGVGLEGAEVQLKGSGFDTLYVGSTDSTSTDVAGAFVLGGVPLGARFRVAARREGLAPAEVEVALSSDRRTARVEIMLREGCTVRGRVLDQSNRPVAGARLKLWPSLVASGSDSFVAMARVRSVAAEAQPTAESDANGDYRFTGLAPGRFEVSARAPGFAPAQVRDIEIAEGARDVAVDAITLARGSRIEGRVVDGARRPLVGARVSAIGEGQDRIGGVSFSGVPVEQHPNAVSTASGPEGRFVLDGLDQRRRHYLQVRLDGYAPAARASVQPGGAPLSIVLERALTLPGQVVDEQGEGIAGAQVYGRPRLSHPSGGSTYAAPPPMMRATAGWDGRFALKGLAPGGAKVGASDPSYLADELDVTLRAGSVPEPVVLTLRRALALGGRVTGADGTPVVGATFVIGRAHQNGGVSSETAEAHTDLEGRYRIGGLEPGHVTVTVTHPDWLSASREANLLPETAGEPNKLDFTLERGFAISGRVLDEATGAPVAAATVWMVPPQSADPMAALPQRTRSDAAGAFVLRGVRPGEVVLRASSDGYAPASLEQPIEVHDDVRGIDLRLGQGTAIVGHLVGLTEAEAKGARVGAFGQASSEPVGLLGSKLAVPDGQGNFRFERLEVGEWEIRADVGSREQSLRVRIAPGDREVPVELVFENGYRLAGTVFHDGVPATGYEVAALGARGVGSGHSVVDQGGRFSLENLPAGSYSLQVRSAEGDTPYAQRLELDGDRDVTIELEELEISGQVVAADTGEAIAGATVELRRMPDDGAASDDGSGALPMRSFSTKTDQLGAFRLVSGRGRYRLRVSRESFGSRERILDLSYGQSERDLRLELDTTAGLELLVSNTKGGPIRSLWIGGTNTATQASYLRLLYPDPNGRLVLDDLAEGDWTLTISGAGLSTTVAVTVPGPLQRIALPLSGRVLVQVQSLRGVDTSATVRLIGADGRPHRTASATGVEESFAMRNGTVVIRGVPAGDWTVVVEAQDGRRWEVVVPVLAERFARVVL